MKKLLYVDVSPESYSSEMSQRRVRMEQKLIAKGLGGKFDVTSVNNFHSYKVDELLRNNFDALVTHVPYTQSHYMPYQKSLSKLELLHILHPNLFIVAYTGASIGDIPDEEFRDIGVKAVVRRRTPEEDLPKLISALEFIFE